MPELPEVETIRRSLLPSVKGKIIQQLVLDTASVFSDPDPGQIKDMQVADILRRGKYLIFLLSSPLKGQLWLLVHLRMTGRLLLQEAAEPVEKHTHVRFGLARPDGSAKIWLIFQDTRRFGRVWLEPVRKDEALPGSLAKLGPEPFSAELSSQILEQQLKNHPRLNLKAALLDQTIIAGLGNIYADEILFAAGLAPQRLVGSLTKKDLADLALQIPLVIKQAIKFCGTTFSDYVDGWNQSGSFQNYLKVYGKAGQACQSCGQLIQKTKLAGRTTSWCPACQPGS